MTASAQGIDVSSYQADLTVAELSRYQFAFCKATEGTSGVDPHFAANWAIMGAAGLVRGAYHELVPSENLTSQIAHFVTTVHAHGLPAGSMLAIVASDYAGTNTQMIEAACAQAQSLAGPHVVVMVYSDLSVARTLTTCTRYPLWLAWYSSTAPASVAPWPHWTFWQWSETPEDEDAFNGTAADLKAFIDGYLPKPPPAPKPTPAPPLEEEMPAGDNLIPGVRATTTWAAGTVGQIVLACDWEGKLTAAPQVRVRIRHETGNNWYDAGLQTVDGSYTYTIGTKSDVNACSLEVQPYTPVATGDVVTVGYHTNA